MLMTLSIEKAVRLADEVSEIIDNDLAQNIHSLDRWWKQFITDVELAVYFGCSSVQFSDKYYLKEAITQLEKRDAKNYILQESK